MPEHVGRADQLRLRQRLDQPVPVDRQDAEVVDPDGRALETALLDRRNQRCDRVAVVAFAASMVPSRCSTGSSVAAASVSTANRP